MDYDMEKRFTEHACSEWRRRASTPNEKEWILVVEEEHGTLRRACSTVRTADTEVIQLARIAACERWDSRTTR
jgi:hypothetical protein